MEVHVPHDFISNHILPKVPAKSVGRFKCVSKEWHSFLASDMFQNTHIYHHQNNIKLLVLSRSETSLEFTTIDCEAPPSDKVLTPTRRPLPPFKGINPRIIRVLASFNGLVCLGISIYEYADYFSHLILWNPLTNEYKRLSKSNYPHSQYYSSTFGLYYSSSEDDYKLLHVADNCRNNVYIYSLKSDSWAEEGNCPVTRIVNETWSRCTFLNGSIYFLTKTSSDEWLISILRFDTKTKLFSKIETPDDFRMAYNITGTIMVNSDCIHVCVKYDTYKYSDRTMTTCIKLWKLDEYGNMEEVVNFQHDYNHIISDMIPFHLLKNGNWLVRNCSSYGHKIYKVDLKDNGKEKGNTYDDYEYAGFRVDGNNNIVVAEEGRYIETFVSPNRYTK